jgi:hypothetical protein
VLRAAGLETVLIHAQYFGSFIENDIAVDGSTAMVV